MNFLDKIIENVNATMNMEDMPLSDENRKYMRECIEGQIEFQDVVNALIFKYRHTKEL